LDQNNLQQANYQQITDFSWITRGSPKTVQQIHYELFTKILIV